VSEPLARLAAGDNIGAGHRFRYRATRNPNPGTEWLTTTTDRG